MSKPDREQVIAAYHASPFGSNSEGWTRVVALIDAWAAEDEAERARGRAAVELVREYASHKAWCPAKGTSCACTCGFDAAFSAIAGNAPALASPAPCSEPLYAEETENERFNREQRIRREAYATGHAFLSGDRALSELLAARNYPLRKRVSRVVPDPHGLGEWSVRPVPAFDAPHAHWRANAREVWEAHRLDLLLSGERVEVIRDLMLSPWAWEDDTSVEGEAAS